MLCILESSFHLDPASIYLLFSIYCLPKNFFKLFLWSFSLFLIKKINKINSSQQHSNRHPPLLFLTLNFSQNSLSSSFFLPASSTTVKCRPCMTSPHVPYTSWPRCSGQFVEPDISVYTTSSERARLLGWTWMLRCWQPRCLWPWWRREKNGMMCQAKRLIFISCCVVCVNDEEWDDMQSKKSGVLISFSVACANIHVLLIVCL